MTKENHRNDKLKKSLKAIREGYNHKEKNDMWSIMAQNATRN